MASTYLSRTPSSSGSNTTWTFSTWLKRTALGLDTVPFATGYASPQIDEMIINLGADDQLRFNINVNDVTDVTVKSSRKLRDMSAWYHIVVKCDTTQATASDRVKIYINGEEETNLATADYPTQGQSTFVGDTSKEQKIGLQPRTSNYLNGLMTHTHFTDGTAYDASTFGESDANGVWKPKTSPSVTYGTNGFFLKMENSGSMGTDSSGNANNFTVNGSLTQTLDTPSNVYATFNPLDVPEVAEKPTMSYGNLQGASTALGHVSGISTLGADTGKWYSEFKLTATDDATNCLCGVVKDAGFNLGTNALHDSTYFYGARGNGYKFTASSGTASWGSTWTTNDIIGLGLDCDNGRLYVSKNGQWSDGSGNYNQSTPSAYVTLPTSSLYFLCCGDAGNTTTATFQANFGNGYFGTSPVASAGSNGNGSIFEYDVPTGYYALNTKNLATYG